MKIRIAMLVTPVTLVTSLALAANKPGQKPAPAPYAKTVSEGVKLIGYGGKDPCVNRHLLFTFKVIGAGKHHYRFVFSDGSTKDGRDIVLTPGREAGMQTDWTYTNTSKNMTVWAAVAFDGGAAGYHSTYHDTCQRH